MKTLKLITIISLLQFIAFTSFGMESKTLSSRNKASLTQDRALSLLDPSEFASIAGTSSEEARMILSSIVDDTINSVNSNVTYDRLDSRVEALLKAVHYAKKTAQVDLYPEISILKNVQFKANLERAIRRIKASNKKDAQEIMLHLKTETVI